VIAAGGLADVVLAHLPAIHSSVDAAPLEVGGDSPTVDAEISSKIGQLECLDVARSKHREM
jgi:hypothetical protein